MKAVAVWPASACSRSISSLFSGSKPSLRPTPMIAMTSPFARQGK